MSIAEHIFRTISLLGFLALILILGWNEPLKYRFMSRAEIYALENPQQHQPEEVDEEVVVKKKESVPVTDKNWMWDRNRPNLLEQGAYKSGSGSVRRP